MSYIRTTFLGKEYSIPEDVLIYIDLLDFTESVKKQLVNAFVWKLNNEIQKGNTACLDDKDLAAEIDQQVGRFIAKLCDNGIFNRTINDYLRTNKGYQLFSDVNKAALEKMKSLLIREMDSWQAGFEDALQKKESSITGMGFSIWSSSFINHAIYAAMEASTVDKQEKAAAVQYQKDMNELRAKLDSQYGKEKSAYVHNTYIPNMEAALTVFAYELLDKYVADLIANGKFDASALDFVDISRSNDLLKNLTLSNNKQVILENAFATCPYNIAVYMQAMKYDLLDYDSFQTAKLFKQGSTIISFLEENLGDAPNSKKRQLNFKNAELLSLYSGRSLREITSYVADFIINGYAQAVAMLTNTAPCYDIMNKVEEREILAGDGISKQKSNWLVDPLAPTALWDKLTSEYGHTDLLERLLSLLPDRPVINSKQEYDAFLKNKLFAILKTIRQERVAKSHEQRQEDARRKAAEAEKARLTAERNKKIKKIGLVAAIVVIIIAIASAIITKVNNEKAYQEMAGEFCVYRVINDDGEEKNEFNWWLSIGEDGTMKMTSWSYAFEDCEVDSYSGTIKSKANFRKLEDYRIEDYCAEVSEYEKALYCYQFQIADEWDEFNGYIICWQYQNGKAIDVYCDDYRYSFVETGSDYSFTQWLDEINSDHLSGKVQNIIDNLDVSEDDAIERIEQQFNDCGYDGAVEAIVTSRLSDERKKVCYEDLVDRIDFSSFEVNGLVFHIPEHWFVQEYSDPNIKEAKYSEDDSLFFLYVKYMGTTDQVADEGDDYWKTRNDFSETTISGCSSAYVRFDSGHNNKDEQYFVIEYFIECDGQVYQIQFLAYDGRYYEPEAWMLLDRVEFTNYAENRANLQEQTYLKAIELFNEKKYDEALAVFETIVEYKDCEDKITECTTAIAEEKYANAVALISIGNYEDAYNILVVLKSHPAATATLKNFKLVWTQSQYIDLKFSDSSSTSTYTYDEYGRIQKEVVTLSNKKETVVTYSYNTQGNLIQKVYTYSDGDTSAYKYVYDSENNLIEEQFTYPDGDTEKSRYIYDSNGTLTTKITVNSSGVEYTYTYEYEYIDTGYLSRMTERLDETDWVIEYEYDSNQMVCKVSEYKNEKLISYETYSDMLVLYSPNGF